MNVGEACTQCGAAVVAADRFCESCGTVQSAVRFVTVPRVAAETSGVCSDCGDGTYVDQYCSVCGQRRQEPDRDQAHLDGIVLVTDRGLEHPRNEDAAAAGAVACGSGVAFAVAVCDGVSSSSAADRAAKGASAAGVNAMLNTLAAECEPESAVRAGLAEAAKAAAAAGLDIGDSAIAPSCTYAAVAVLQTPAETVQIAVGNVGDSRIYWIPEPPTHARCLTVDDSVAQELISAGAAADSEAVQVGAHTLTRWLGADAGATPWSDSSVRPISITGPGVCCSAPTGSGTTFPTPTTSRASATETTRRRQPAPSSTLR